MGLIFFASSGCSLTFFNSLHAAQVFAWSMLAFVLAGVVVGAGLLITARKRKRTAPRL